ncbi:MAG TPA: 2,3,4,5-tetrahydropyridine-2,6-dicarboxylate N-succinyltransferase, partial [Bacteroidia bacterium]|nr:2,3,4,5-tetrahydropyridine-2,6-dicarboxylate N-succinyltransferase [Bacteroidia bacterium]
MPVREKTVNAIWENRALLTDESNKKVIRSVIEDLDKGNIRVAEQMNNSWRVNEWIKKDVILYFPIQKIEVHHAGPREFYDKIDVKKGYENLGVS